MITFFVWFCFLRFEEEIEIVKLSGIFLEGGFENFSSVEGKWMGVCVYLRFRFI